MLRPVVAGIVLGCALAWSIPLDAQEAVLARDSTFLLVADDPGRSPSPFIGNGRHAVVIPALGIGASSSFVAGLYEKAPSDVPRLAAVPAWNAISVFDGVGWLNTSPQPDDAVSAYRQVVDMRTGTAHTRYNWVNGARRTSIRVETFVSRADPHLAAIRLVLTPQSRGRMRVRFALAGQQPPQRLPLDTLEAVEPSWGPAELWYPGHMVVQSRSATHEAAGGRIELTATPVGRTTTLAQVASVTWEPELPLRDGCGWLSPAGDLGLYTPTTGRAGPRARLPAGASLTDQTSGPPQPEGSGATLRRSG